MGVLSWSTRVGGSDEEGVGAVPGSGRRKKADPRSSRRPAPLSNLAQPRQSRDSNT